MAQSETLPPRTHVLSAGSGRNGRDAAGVLVAVVGEALVAGLAVNSAPLIAVLALHAVVVTVLAVVVFHRRQPQPDATSAWAMALVVAFAGPAGALAAGIMHVAMRLHSEPASTVLSAWYERLARAGGSDAISEVFDRVSAGRVIRADANPTQDFMQVIESGTLEQRQAALGLMAREFHTDFAPALKLALRSAEPVVRVQAAAVVARVRADLKSQIATLAASNAGAPTLSGAVALGELARCALVDEADARRCADSAHTALGRMLATRAQVVRAAARASAEERRMIERHLLAAGRLDLFRACRRVAAVIDRRPRYRIRLITARVGA